jgi:beta-lactamase regulating signal transducer with metallopeptidase domain
MFVATAIRAYDPAAAPIATSSEAVAAGTVTVPLSKIPSVIVATATEGWRDRAIDAVTSARQSLPSVVAIWLVGVVFLSGRLLISFLRVHSLAHRGVREASPEWQRVAAGLSEALGLRRAVRLLESAAVEVPSVLGSLRPIILLPASTLTGLTPEQIEMVLAHELAHIRRHDFAINLLQAFVETMMFYHPAVWWMSSRVRIERENCCDDLAVAVCGNPIQYARALTRLEELRAGTMPVMVAANGASLLDRIRRIAGGRPESTGVSSRWAAAVAMLAILAVALIVPSVPALAQREEGRAEEKEAPQAARSSVEVVEAAEADADDAEADAHIDIDVDPYIDLDTDIDTDIDIDTDLDLDTDIDLDDEDWPVAVAPIAPVPPVPPVPPVAGHHRNGSPVAPPAPATPMVTPAAPHPPHAPRAPLPMMAALDRMNFDEDEQHGDASDRKLSDAGKLTVDELISLRAVGVTPEYIKTMRGHFPDLTVRGVTGLRAVDVTPEFIAEMRNAGLTVKSARAASSLAAVGVTPAYIREMREAGLPVTTERDASGMKAVGVTPEFVREMRSAGFEVKTARDASSLAAVGVTAEYIRELRAAGVDVKTAREASSLRAVGVTVKFVKKLADAGYKNLSPRELSRLAAVGIDDDFIRDMDQYRDKH